MFIRLHEKSLYSQIMANKLKKKRQIQLKLNLQYHCAFKQPLTMCHFQAIVLTSSERLELRVNRWVGGDSLIALGKDREKDLRGKSTAVDVCQRRGSASRTDR